MAKEILLSAREERFDSKADNFIKESVWLYDVCLNYVEKCEPLSNFKCFIWVNLNAKVFMNETQKCNQFWTDKGTGIHYVKCCDQVPNMNKFLVYGIQK